MSTSYNKLWWETAWFAAYQYVDVDYPHWRDSGVYDMPDLGAISRITLAGSVHVSGAIRFDPIGTPKQITQVGQTAMAGALAMLPSSFAYKITDPFPIELPLYISPTGVVRAFGVIGWTIPVDTTAEFVQVGAFTVRGTLQASGNIVFTLGPDVPHAIVQVGAIHPTGIVKVLGQIGTRKSTFSLLTQPIGAVGVLSLSGLLRAESAFSFTHVAHTPIVGVITLLDNHFRYESFTEGLPRGWFVDGPILETVPNPNYGTAYGNHFFRRYTWKGYDPAGTMVAASGSEDDCFAQTLSVCQMRHEKWRELAR